MRWSIPRFVVVLSSVWVLGAIPLAADTLDDGVLLFRGIDRSRVSWESDNTFWSYNLYRGSLAALRSGGAYTEPPGANPYAERFCHLARTEFIDSLAPTPGEALYWLVTGDGVAGESGLGDGDTVSRPNDNPCPPAEPPDGGYFDRTVDLSSLPPDADACRALRAALQPYNTGAAGGQLWRVRVTGAGTVGFGDLARSVGTNDATLYRYCFGLIPDVPPDPKGLVNLDEDANRIHLFFDDATLRFDATGQTETAVLFVLGDLYRRGARPDGEMDGYIIGGVRISGKLTVERPSANVAPGWAAGRIPGLPFSLHGSPSEFVGLFENGLLRADLTALTLELNGPPGEVDHDDVALIHDDGWTIYRGPLRVERFGVGVVSYGNSVGTLRGGRLAFNDVGITLGDPYIGGRAIPAAECLNGGCGPGVADAYEFNVEEMTLVENEFGNLLLTGASRFLFSGGHAGQPSPHGVEMLFGAGFCPAADYVPCATDGDCGPSGGTCTKPADAGVYGAWVLAARDAPVEDRLVGRVALGPAAYTGIAGSTHNYFEDPQLASFATFNPAANGLLALASSRFSPPDQGLPPRYLPVALAAEEPVDRVLSGVVPAGAYPLEPNRRESCVLMDLSSGGGSSSLRGGVPCADPASVLFVARPSWIHSLSVVYRGGMGGPPIPPDQSCDVQVLVNGAPVGEKVHYGHTTDFPPAFRGDGTEQMSGVYTRVGPGDRIQVVIGEDSDADCQARVNCACLNFSGTVSLLAAPLDSGGASARAGDVTSATPPAPPAAPRQVFDRVVDLSRAADPCGAIRGALEPFLDGTAQAWAVRLVQSSPTPVRIGFGDLREMGPGGQYRLCFGLIPAGIAGSALGSLDLVFDNVNLAFDAAAQTKPVAFFQLGDLYNQGDAGRIGSGVHLRGRFNLERQDARDAGWPRGKIPSLPFDAASSSPTEFVALFESGAGAIDLTEFSVSLLGPKPADTDDVGLIHQDGTTLGRGFFNLRRFGTGMIFYGDSGGTFHGVNVEECSVGVALGDPRVGGDVVSAAGARAASTARGAEFRSGVIEGNGYGNLVVTDAEDAVFEGIHFEHGYFWGHSILIGAGFCPADGYRPCGDDTGCDAGACQLTADASSIGDLRFTGGVIGGDNTYATSQPQEANRWDGLFLGPGAKGSGTLRLEAEVGASDIDPTAADGVGSDNCRDYLTDSTPEFDCRPFGFHPDANMTVDMRQARYYHDLDVVPPDYLQVELSGQGEFSRRIEAQAWLSSQCVRLDSAEPLRTGALCSEPGVMHAPPAATWLRSVTVTRTDGGSIPPTNLCAIRILVEGSVFMPRPEQELATIYPLDPTQRVGVFEKVLLGHALKIQLGSPFGHARCDYQGTVTFEYGRLR